MKKIFIILLLIISVGCSKQEIIDDNKENNEIIENENQNNNQLENNEIIPKEDNDSQISEGPINVYLFWGDACGACANLKEFFDNLDSSYNKYFNLIKYEVWNNEENKELMHKVGDFLNQTYYAVPFLVVGDEVIIGASEATKEYILDKIIEEYNNDRYDVMDNLNN